MEVHTERLQADSILAKSGGSVDLSKARTFILPQMPTASLPDPATVNGMLVWDTTASALKLASGAVWELIAILS